MTKNKNNNNVLFVPLVCALTLLSLVCLCAGASSADSCGCPDLESDGIDYGDEGCCAGHTSVHVGDFSPFLFNESASYAALGSVRAQFYSTLPHTPTDLFETVIIVEPAKKIMYQSGVGYQGSGTWYFPNGTRLLFFFSSLPHTHTFSPPAHSCHFFFQKKTRNLSRAAGERRPLCVPVLECHL